MPKQKFPEGTQIKVTKQLDEPFIGSLPKGTYDVNDRRLKGYGSLLVKRKLAKLVTPETEDTNEAAEGFVENGEVLLAPGANEPYDRLTEFDKPADAGNPFANVANSVKKRG
jgi:hypothetical protein